jgi:hypothetical protein
MLVLFVSLAIIATRANSSFNLTIRDTIPFTSFWCLLTFVKKGCLVYQGYLTYTKFLMFANCCENIYCPGTAVKLLLCDHGVMC